MAYDCSFAFKLLNYSSSLALPWGVAEAADATGCVHDTFNTWCTIIPVAGPRQTKTCAVNVARCVVYKLAFSIQYRCRM